MSFNTSVSAKFRLAKAEVPDKDGLIYPLKVLIELASTDPHLEMLGDELWYRELNNHKAFSSKIAIVYPFDHFPTCLKCGQVHLFKHPIVKYLEGFNRLEKTCINCGFSWIEECYPFRKKDKK